MTSQTRPNQSQSSQMMAAGLQAALQEPGLIRGALKRAGISYYHQDYDDFWQEALIAFAEAYQYYPGDPKHDDRFKGYAFQNIVWRMTDLWRYRQRRDHDDLSAVSLPASLLATFDADSDWRLLLQNAWQRSKKLDRLIIRRHFIEGEPLSLIARQYHVSPRTLRARRAKLRQEFNRQSTSS